MTLPVQQPGVGTMCHYEAIIIGSGQGGGPLAQAFANAGRTTALIEATHVGGTCINEGCTPTKTMIASGRAAYAVFGAKSMGIALKRSSLHMKPEIVRQRKRDMVDSFRKASEKRIRDTPNLDLIMGKARFISSNEIEVVLNETRQTQKYTADKIFINVGCSPEPLTIKGADIIEAANVFTSTTITEIQEVPRHLLVIGGGPIAVEFAQLFRRFGSNVSIVQRADHLLPNEDTDISVEMEKILTEDGIKLYLGSQSQWFAKVPTGSMVLQIKTNTDDIKSIFATHVLNATGRRPNTESLNLKDGGVNIDARGFVEVNDHLETSAPDIYALGDVKGGPAFTHISYDDFRILKHNLITHSTCAPLSIADRQIPYCVFTDPQLGRIGLTERQARALYPPTLSTSTRNEPTTNNTDTPPLTPEADEDQTPTLEVPIPPSTSQAKTQPNTRIRTSTLPFSSIARALEINEPRGFMKAVVDKETDNILGFACLGYEGGEVMSIVQMAMKGGVKASEIADMTFAHPCLAEGLNTLFGAFQEEKEGS